MVGCPSRRSDSRLAGCHSMCPCGLVLEHYVSVLFYTIIQSMRLTFVRHGVHFIQKSKDYKKKVNMPSIKVEDVEEPAP